MSLAYAHTARPDTGTSSATLGMVLFLAAEAMFFGALYSSYAFLNTAAEAWPSGRETLPVGVLSVAALAGIAAALRAWRLPHAKRRRSAAWQTAGLGLAAAGLLAYAAYGLWTGGAPPATSTFHAIFYVLTATQAVHLAAGALVTPALLHVPGIPPAQAAARSTCLTLYWLFTALTGAINWGLFFAG